MKKTILGLMVMVVMFAGSCKKNSSTNAAPSANSWTFKNTTYIPTNVWQNINGGAGPGVLEVDDTTLAFGPSMYVYFAGHIMPTMGGTYKVVSANYDQIDFSSSTAKEIGIIFYLSGNAYYTTGGNGSNQNVTVSVSQTGKVSISGSAIEVDNLNGNSITSDSSALTLNATQH